MQHDKFYQCGRTSGEPCEDRRNVDMSNEELRQLIKDAQKEGAKEWLSEQRRALERVTFRAVVTVVSSLLVYALFRLALLSGAIDVPGDGR